MLREVRQLKSLGRRDARATSTIESMRLPQELIAAIEREVQSTDSRQLQRAGEELTRRYKAADFGSPIIKSAAERAAYLLVRMPATFAVVRRVLSEIERLAPQAEITSLLDLGSGPGTALFAAAEAFPALRTAQLVEQSRDWLELGKRLAASASDFPLLHSQWLQNDLRTLPDLAPHDLVIASYSLGELPEAQAQTLLRRAWRCASQFVVVIEPGTRRGFATVHAARSALISEGAFILAPCPHRDACPMIAAHDWCHFAQRVERTAQHRRLKGGTLGHEDEKFSYVIAARVNQAPAAARIVRHPKKLSGHVQLSLCTPGGLASETVTRSMREAYKAARQAQWGDAWDATAPHK